MRLRRRRLHRRVTARRRTAAIGSGPSATPAAFARGGGGAFSAVFNHPSGDPSEPLGVSARPARAPAPAETGAFIDYYSSLLGVDKAALTPNRANEE